MFESCEWFGTDPEKLLWNFYQINDLIRNGLGSAFVLGWVVEARKTGWAIGWEDGRLWTGHQRGSCCHQVPRVD